MRAGVALGCGTGPACFPKLVEAGPGLRPAWGWGLPLGGAQLLVCVEPLAAGCLKVQVVVMRAGRGRGRRRSPCCAHIQKHWHAPVLVEGARGCEV